MGRPAAISRGPSETLSPVVFSYTAPSINTSHSNIMPFVKEASSSGYNTVALKKPGMATTNFKTTKELILKRPRKIPLNKYGTFAEY